MQLRLNFMPVLILALAVMSLDSAQEGPRIKGHAVLITGENPFISLATETGGKTLTNISFWRVVHSPAGAGHACYVRSDITGNGPSADDVRAVYTDNPKLVEYLNHEIMSIFDKSYAEKPFAVIAASFQKKGDTLTEYREIITAQTTKVELLWKDFYPAIHIEIPIYPVTITTTLIPAKKAEVYINGVKAAGQAYPRPEGTAQGSSGSLAFAETWVK